MERDLGQELEVNSETLRKKEKRLSLSNDSTFVARGNDKKIRNIDAIQYETKDGH